MLVESGKSASNTSQSMPAPTTSTSLPYSAQQPHKCKGGSGGGGLRGGVGAGWGVCGGVGAGGWAHTSSGALTFLYMYFLPSSCLSLLLLLTLLLACVDASEAS